MESWSYGVMECWELPSLHLAPAPLPRCIHRGTIAASMNALHELPVIKDQTAFNLARWAELCADPLWVCVDGKIETDRYGQVIMSVSWPSPAPTDSDSSSFPNGVCERNSSGEILFR